MISKEEKLTKLAESIKKLNKAFGEGSVVSLGEKAAPIENVISTGSLGLDIALGVGGLPKGRIVEIFGPESSGKTTLATHIMAEAQKLGGICAIVDAEHAFDKNYASQIGVNVDELFIAQPSCAEEALQTANELISSGGIDVVVIDSVAALVPRKELDGEVGDNSIGVQARLMGQALRMIVGVAAKNDVLVIFINQLREKIGVMFGSPETTSGGNALKFYASVRLDVRRSYSGDNAVKSGDTIMGNLVKVKVIKNKVSPPFTTAEFDVLYGVGIDKVGEIIQIGSNKGILKKWGKQITYLDNKYDINDFALMIRDNEEFKQELFNKIKNA